MSEPRKESGTPPEGPALTESAKSTKAAESVSPLDTDRLERLRARILEVDEELVRLAGERLSLVLEIGEAKAALGKPVLDPGREAAVVRRAAARARELGVEEELVRDLIWRIIDAARQRQEGRSSWGPPPSVAPGPDRVDGAEED